MQLPTSPRLSILDPEGFKWLIMSEQGVGKSSLLMSIQTYLTSQGKPPILIIDPESNIALSGYVVPITKWMDDLELLKTLQKEKPNFSWVGVDNLNMHYDMCFNAYLKKAGIDYPPEDYGKTESIITNQFVTWLRGVINIGIPLIATCHLNMTEVKIRGNPFNRYIPAFRGSSARSAYKQVLQSFDILGFMTFETKSKEEPPKDLKKDLPSSVLAIDPEIAEVRVIHFQPSQYWDAQVPLNLLPSKVTLPSDWEEDWILILENWRKEK